MFGAGGNFPPPDPPPGYLTRITSKGRRRRALGILTAETAIVEKPADEDEHAGHHHGHVH